MAGAYYHRSVDYVAEVLTGYMTSVPSCVFSNLNILGSKKKYPSDCREEIAIAYINLKFTEIQNLQILRITKQNRKTHLLKIVKHRGLIKFFILISEPG